ncbi:hypothetical protein O3P69_020430 [Scylla paramamosain]|uniref:Uncharacterized protein n=1 Tax=Scylla paramamosain TaxID=85552 RepID=A0AAW0TLP5_SCYPA
MTSGSLPYLGIACYLSDTKTQVPPEPPSLCPHTRLRAMTAPPGQGTRDRLCMRESPRRRSGQPGVYVRTNKPPNHRLQSPILFDPLLRLGRTRCTDRKDR